MERFASGCFFLITSVLAICPSGQATGQTPPSPTTRGDLTFQYQPSPPDNPLRGLVPYAGGDKRDLFPHSLEFNYLPLSDLMIGIDQFDWQPLEELLTDVASRGHQTVFRVWMVYPGHEDGIPEFLVRDGVKVTEWLNTNTQPFPPKKVRTPDYDDPRMVRALRNFIAALGKKYDGDPRIGFITAGLLGTWGEWHEYPRDDLFANKQTQREIMDAFERAFSVTPILLRYPAGQDHWHYAENDQRRFGYHDDSFAWATLDTGREEDNWFFVPATNRAGPAAVDKWKQAPIGGEIRPELWGKIFDDPPSHDKAQSFSKCVQQTHASWLMDTGMFNEKQPDARRRNAIAEVSRMGYEFHLSAARATRQGDQIEVSVDVQNRGVAPFYYDWKLELALLDAGASPTRTWSTDWKLTGLLPGQQRRWTMKIPASEVSDDTPIALRVVNPLSGGLPLRFANARQRDNGWIDVARP